MAGNGFLIGHDVIAQMVNFCTIIGSLLYRARRRVKKNGAKQLEKKENQLRNTSK